MSSIEALQAEINTQNQEAEKLRVQIAQMEAKLDANKKAYPQERRWRELSENEQLRRARSYQSRHECSLFDALEALERWG